MEKTAKKNALLLVAILSTLLAIGFHLYLNKLHIDLKVGLGGQSLCNINEVLNCDAVASSKYAELFGIPMALLGALANGLLLVFLLLTRFNFTENPEKSARYTFYLSSFIFLMSLVMGTISLTAMQNICIFCVGTYVLSLITLICVWLAFKPGFSYLIDDIRDLFTTEKWILGALISIPVLGFIINNMSLDSHGYRELEKASQDSIAGWNVAPQQNFDLQNGLSFQVGTQEPKIVIVEFADFLCPHCKHAAPVLKSFAKSHPEVKIIFKSFPLDGKCNPAIQQTGDGVRCELAYATFCSEKLAKKGWIAHDFIFDSQEKLFSVSNLEGTIQELSKLTEIDPAQLKDCMKSPEIQEAVKSMANEGDKAQIGGTPSIFVNGKFLRSGQAKPVLEGFYRGFTR